MKAVKYWFGSVAMLLYLQGSAQNSPDPGFELYILAGQSNMAGRGPLTASLKTEGNERVLTLTKDRKWVPARHPLHFDKPAMVGAGPGLAFGMAMADASPGKRIGLIPCAVGGTPIEHWLPGAYDSATNTHPYDDAAERIQFAMQAGVIKGIIWHQGEANSAPGKASQYLIQLTELIKRFRTLTGNPQLPFVAGELGYFFTPAPNINQQLAVLPSLVANTAVAGADRLTDKGDQLHFDAASAGELGKRYAVKMLLLQKR
jgi:Carbohydrate esterase, sialic acid-specific acetylesterase